MHIFLQITLQKSAHTRNTMRLRPDTEEIPQMTDEVERAIHMEKKKKKPQPKTQSKWNS